MGEAAFPSPNFGPRRDGAVPDLIVLHYTGMASRDAALERLCDPAAEVSAHYLIARDGAITALVEETARAWHAGAGEWAGASDVNSRSIGIELCNAGDHPFAARQMTALAGLMANVMERWAIPPHRVIGHSDMAPLRKRDPGPRFDWRGLALQGVSVWPDPTVSQDADFTASARAFGYPDLPEPVLLEAFRLRFRPWAKGPLDAQDRAMAADLALRFGVDAGARFA